MFGIDILVQKVSLLAILVIVGVILKKIGKADGNMAKNLADLVVYVAQPIMIIYSFLEASLSKRVLQTSLCVFVCSLVFHILFLVVALCLFKKAPLQRKKTLRYSTVFTNAGFMGIPLLMQLISSEAAVYATVYVFVFNLFCWSFGAYLYTNDRKYVSVKKMIINPATIPAYIGISLLLIATYVKLPSAISPAFTEFIVPVVKDNFLYLCKDLALIFAMIMIGVRLADCDFKTLFNDKYLALLIFVRLIALPLIVLCILKGISVLNIVPESIIVPTANVVVISASTPVAAMASVFAERYDGDTVYAGKVVSSTTLISLLTMPLIALLLTMWF